MSRNLNSGMQTKNSADKLVSFGVTSSVSVVLNVMCHINPKVENILTVF